jgi:hypothetical protein
MYTFGVTTSRCSLCYALLSTNTNPSRSTIGYSFTRDDVSSCRHRRYIHAATLLLMMLVE